VVAHAPGSSCACRSAPTTPARRRRWCRRRSRTGRPRRRCTATSSGPCPPTRRGSSAPRSSRQSTQHHRETKYSEVRTLDARRKEEKTAKLFGYTTYQQLELLFAGAGELQRPDPVGLGGGHGKDGLLLGAARRGPRVQECLTTQKVQLQGVSARMPYPERSFSLEIRALSPPNKLR
jgi:hypothetical protein